MTKKIKINFDTNTHDKGTRTKCPHCGSKSVVKGINGNGWVLYNAGTQTLHNCTRATNPWDNY